MKVEKISSKEFPVEVLQAREPVLIDFYADWCGPCKMLSPIIDEVAQENDDIKVVKVNVDESSDIALEYKVMSIPTLVVIKNGQEVIFRTKFKRSGSLFFRNSANSSLSSSMVKSPLK